MRLILVTHRTGRAVRKDTQMKELLRTIGIVKREDGQALADYALILTFIFAVCVIAVGLLGLAIATSFGNIIPGF